MVQEGGKRKSSRSSKKSKVSRKSSRRSVSKKSKASRKPSKKSSRRSVSKKSKASKKGSKKSRREANPQITVRGALVKYVWANLDVKKEAEAKGMKPIGIPAKIVQMAMMEAQKSHPVTEANKKSAAFWEGVKKTAMKLLADNLHKYAGAVKK